MKTKKKKIKTDRFIIFMTVACLALLITWVIVDNKKIANDKDTQTPEISSIDFHEVSLEEALKIINSGELSLIYIGYEGCAPCDRFAPRLDDVAKEYNIRVNYLNYKDIEKTSKDWEDFTKKFTKQQTINIKNEEDISSNTKTIGRFLFEDGYTPTFAIFKHSEMIDGNIGGKKRAELRELLENAGYEK